MRETVRIFDAEHSIIIAKIDASEVLWRRFRLAASADGISLRRGSGDKVTKRALVLAG